MDATRALLDALMGPNRNQKEENSGQPDFTDSTVCKNFLVGFCPSDWFTTAKRGLKPCNKIHSEIMKEKLEAHPDSKVYRAEFEEDFLMYLEMLARECDAFIMKERTKCRAPGGKTVSFPNDVQEKCDDLERRYAECVKAAKALEDESLTRSKEQMAKAITLKEELDGLKAKHTVDFGGEDICEVCGVKYPLGDIAHDKTSHYRGKTHEGFVQIRSKIKELRGKRKEWDRQREKMAELKERRLKVEKDKEKERRRKEKELEKEREKERERDREREALRDKELEKIREREREKVKEKERQRELEREREREREKELEKQRELEREREKERALEREREKEKKELEHSQSKGSKDRSQSRKRRTPSPDPTGVAALWERVRKLGPQEQAAAMAGLDDHTMDLLQAFLESRVKSKAHKKSKTKS